MKTYLIADTHFNHAKIATYCDRPENFTNLIERGWSQTVKSKDVVIHLGDVTIGGPKGAAAAADLLYVLPGRKILVRGNHDRQHSNVWWMTHGFDFACDSMTFRGCLLTHEPYAAPALPPGVVLNIHGHLHNIWHGFHPNASVDGYEEEEMKYLNRLKHPWQRLFAIEYTGYHPVEFEKFVSQPDKFFARGIPNEDKKQ